MLFRVSPIVSQLFQVITLAKCVTSIMALNWYQRFIEKTKVKICGQVLTSSTQRQNRSFVVFGRTRTAMKCTERKIHVQSVYNYCFSLLNMQICDVIVNCSYVRGVLGV